MADAICKGCGVKTSSPKKCNKCGNILCYSCVTKGNNGSTGQCQHKPGGTPKCSGYYH